MKDKTAQLLEMLSLVDEAEKVLTSGRHDENLDEFGRLLDHTWRLKRGITSRISTDSIDGLYEKALAAGALGGKLLRIKPCIAVQDGSMKMVDKFRGSFDKCVEKYVKEQLKDRKDRRLDRIFITHSPVDSGAVEIARETIKKYAEFENIYEPEAQCTVACHCGPGTLGVLFITQ